ncbi:hypothetical protein ACFO5Q_06870 [Kordiimonas lipolytica]|uniref:Uncharacterized protein n=1 Tax=Kordiimonas lipolytica TaxID=1662421 RepID=A0ABV8U9P9_9PROT|nr:hypothetical protein [Kordiimonas lipolytica]
MPDQQHWEWTAETGPRGNLREAVALFSTEDDLQAAVDDLECHGFSNAAVSRPKPIKDIEAAVHHPVNSIQELEDDASVPREAYIDKDSRSSGMMVMIVVPVYVLLLAGAGIAAGHGLATWEAVVLTVGLGLIGMLGGGYYAMRYARRASERVREEQARGGLLLWVRTGSRAQEDRALEILRRHAGRDVHLHGPAIH